MRGTFKLCNIDSIDASMTISMTVKEWRELRNQLSDEWPSWDLSSQISKLIAQAESTFYARTEDE